LRNKVPGIVTKNASALFVNQEITYYWCSCGGKRDVRDDAPPDPHERTMNPSISFTADRSGKVRICCCRTTPTALTKARPARETTRAGRYRAARQSTG
jgi:hypothetical protein